MKKKMRRAEPMAEATDILERQEALNPSRSFIVQAPAGSGKTTLLIQRFLRLLSVVQKPEEVLAITFTRKAAGEMHCRIMAALECAAEGFKPGDARNSSEAKTLDLANKAFLADKKYGWNLLENPGRLRVLTIDSFCALLVRQMPLLSRLGMEPAVTERPGPLYEEAVRRTLAMLDNDDKLAPPIMQLLRYNDNMAGDLEKKLVVMLAKRDQWLRHIPGETDIQASEMRPGLEASLERLVQEGLGRAVHALEPKYSDLLVSSARYAGAHVADESPIASLRNLEGLPDDRADNLGLWKAMTVLLIPASKDTWRSLRGVTKSIGFSTDKTDEAKEAKKNFKSLLLALEGNDELLQALLEVRRLPGPSYEEDDWKTLCALLRLLPVARLRLLEVFREEGVLDFPAVSLAAIKALGPEEMPTDLMLLLDNTYRHILVDEYQDTSNTQVSLIKALTNGWEPDDGRTLFLVGDPMQSIYRFRDADVGLFLRAVKEGLGAVQLSYIRLKSNFRSEGHIVNWVNKTFSYVFPPISDITTGAVTYAEARAVRGAEEEPAVRIRLYRGRDDEHEANDVLDIITKRKEGESMAVLARSRSHLTAIVERLKATGIDFVAKDLERLAERPVINDLLALERALLNPVDRVAWLAVLRAGWCGLSLADLHALCLGAPDAPLWELINDDRRIEGLSAEGARRLLNLREIMAKAMALRGRQGARPLLEGLWTALGGPALYDDDDSMGEAARFLDIVEALDMDGAALTADELEKRVEGLYAFGSARTENPVQVMTIHGAKGLEFDYVILPGLGRRLRNPDKEILYWMERGADLLLSPMEKKCARDESPVYRYLKNVYRERETLEQTRLFYVAATRAVKELYLFGHINEGDEEIKPDNRSLLRLIDHALNEDMVADAGDEAEVRDEAGLPRPCLKRLADSWSPPASAPPCAPPHERVSRADGPEAMRPVFDWAGAGARHSGTVAHRYLYRIASEGLSEWDAKRVTGEKARMEAMLRGLGLNGQEARAGAERSLNIIIKALSDERGRWILGPHGDGAAEYAVTGLVEGRIRRVIIDRTFVDEKGLRWVIDYKTGEHRGGDLGGFLEAEKERYRSQLEGYAEVLGEGRGEKNIRKGLYYSAIPAWIEW